MQVDPKNQAAVIAAMQDQISDSLLKKLTLYTLQKIGQRAWRGIWGGPVPGGKLAEDLVFDALHDVMIGERHWDIAKNPDLGQFMQGAIDSKVSALVNRAENVREHRAPEKETTEAPDYFDTLKSVIAPLPTEVIDLKEVEAANLQLYFRLMDELKDDAILTKILTCIFEGTDMHDRTQLAKRSEVTPNEITQAWKRLQRRLPAIQKKLADQNPFKNE